MTVTTHAQEDFSYTQDGALVLSEEWMDSFVEEWSDELAWLAER